MAAFRQMSSDKRRSAKQMLAVASLMLLCLAASGGCIDSPAVYIDGSNSGSSSVNGSSDAPTEAIEPRPLGEVFEFGLTSDISSAAGGELRPELAFRYFELLIVSDAPLMEYQIEGALGWNDWQILVPDSSYNGMFAAAVTLDSPATGLRFRTEGEIEYMMFELFEEPVDYLHSAHNHDHDDDTALQFDPVYLELAEAEQKDGTDTDDDLISRPSGLEVRQQELITSCNKRRMAAYSGGRRLADIEVIQMDGKNVGLNTASAYEKMRIAASGSGVNLQVVSGFRTMSEQEYLYNCYQTRRCNNGNLAARPGYSNHQNGIALDLNTHASGVMRWLNANAATYGFRRTVPSEPWHWEYLAGRTVTPQVCSGSSSSPTPSQPTAPEPEPVCRPRAVSGATGTFADLPTGHWARHAADVLFREGITSGCTQSPRMFCPDCPVTRAQAASMIAIALGFPAITPAAPTYEDVPASVAGAGHIEALTRAGVMSGCSTSPRRFCPEADLTRAQAATLLAKAMDLAPQSVQPPTFSDTPAQAFYTPAVERLYSECLLSGCSRSPMKFCPDNSINRGQFAVILVRGMGLGGTTVCGSGKTCVESKCVDVVPLRFTLTWTERIDLDLHILTPTGEKLWYRNRNSSDGGLFDSDTCIGLQCPTDGPLRESVFWGSTPTPGDYTFWAVNYTGERSVPFAIEVKSETDSKTFYDSVPAVRNGESTRFTVNFSNNTLN